MAEDLTDSNANRPEIPSHVYKYRDLGDYDIAPGIPNRAVLRRFFVDNEIWFPSPATFNDPFDCRVHLEFEPHVPPDTQRAILVRLQGDVDGKGVFTVSAKNDDILMWSYYAGGHSGICIEFALMQSFFRMVQPVKYSKAYPLVRATDPPARRMEANLLTKSSAWQHEAEWRIFDIEASPGYRKFPPNLLTGVIFGVRISPQDESMVRGWIAEGPTTPKLYRAVTKDKEYGLRIIPA